MKNFYTPLYIVVLFVILWILSLTPTYAQWPAEVKGKIVLKNVEIREVDSLFLLAFELRIEHQAINNRQSWQIVPELKTAEEVGKYLPTILINGRQKERHFQRKERFDNLWQKNHYPDFHFAINKHTHEEFISYHIEIPYEE